MKEPETVNFYRDGDGTPYLAIQVGGQSFNIQRSREQLLKLISDGMLILVDERGVAQVRTG